MAIVYPDVTTVNQAKLTGLLGLAGWLFSSEFNSDESRLGYLQNRYPNLIESRLNQAFSLTKSAYTAAQILSSTGSVKASQVPRGAIGIPPGMKYAYDVTSVVDFDQELPNGQTKPSHFVNRDILYSESLLNKSDLTTLANERLAEEMENENHYGIDIETIPPGGIHIFFSAITRL